MGVDQLRSLTHALGLDDESVEEVISSKTFQGGKSCSSPARTTHRPESIASSLEDYQRSDESTYRTSRVKSMYNISRSPYMPASSPLRRLTQEASEVDLRHLTCLQYCQVTGCNTCTSTPALDGSSCDDFSISSSQSNLQCNSTLRSQGLYLQTNGQQSSKRSSCSIFKLSSKVLPFSSRNRRSNVTLDKIALPQNAPDKAIKDNPAFAAISAGLAGMPFADLILVCAIDGWETHVHSFILSSTCPMLLQKIKADDTLDLDIESNRQSCFSTSSQTGQMKKSRSRWVKPQCWKRGSKGSKNRTDEANRSCKSGSDSIASKSVLSLSLRPFESASNSRPKRVQVTGCNGPDLRAFFFYLYTGQFRLVSSHSIEGVDDSSAFRGQAKISTTASASESDETAWDPIRIRKSRSLHDFLWPEKGSSMRNRRLSSHTVLSLGSSGQCTTLPFASTCILAAATEDTLQFNTAQAPPFSVQGAYHLSQLFNLTRLACASSTFFLQRLTLTNALQYYISPFSIAYPSIQKGCLEYLVKHWSQVSAQSQSQTILGRLAAGWYPQANMALFQLLAKVE